MLQIKMNDNFRKIQIILNKIPVKWRQIINKIKLKRMIINRTKEMKRFSKKVVQKREI